LGILKENRLGGAGRECGDPVDDPDGISRSKPELCYFRHEFISGGIDPARFRVQHRFAGTFGNLLHTNVYDRSPIRGFRSGMTVSPKVIAIDVTVVQPVADLVPVVLALPFAGIKWKAARHRV